MGSHHQVGLSSGLVTDRSFEFEYALIHTTLRIFMVAFTPLFVRGCKAKREIIRPGAMLWSKIVCKMHLPVRFLLSI